MLNEEDRPRLDHERFGDRDEDEFLGSFEFIGPGGESFHELMAIQTAREAVPGVVSAPYASRCRDAGDHWLVEFTPTEEALGDGVRVAVAKEGLRVLSIVREQ